MIAVILYFKDSFKAEPIVDLLMRHQGDYAFEVSVAKTAPDASGDSVIVTDDQALLGTQSIYIAEKDYRLGNLIDEVQAMLRRVARAQETDHIAIGPYLLNKESHILEGRDGTIRLTEKESLILTVLAQNNGSVIDREVLLERIWGYGENIETHTLETHIYRLRQKIETDPAQPKILLTAENGYRLS